MEEVPRNSPLFYSPYKVLQRIGPVAYKLELPMKARIHPVLHVSQLKKRLGREELCFEQILEIKLILERRMVNREGRAITEVLVKWKKFLVEEASWEV